MGKVLWFAVGVGLTVFVIVKGKELARKVTPAGVQEQVAAKADTLQQRAGEFVANFAEAFAEREGELRAELQLDERAAKRAE